MRNISGSVEYIDFEHFLAFMRTTQRSKMPDETIRAIYRKFADPPSPQLSSTLQAGSDTGCTLLASQQLQEKIMTIEGFTSFLMSSDNMAFSERQLRVCDDMTRPLCEYFISSSHNVRFFFPLRIRSANRMLMMRFIT